MIAWKRLDVSREASLLQSISIGGCSQLHDGKAKGPFFNVCTYMQQKVTQGSKHKDVTESCRVKGDRIPKRGKCLRGDK